MIAAHRSHQLRKVTLKTSRIILTTHPATRKMSTDAFPPPALKQAAQDVASILKERKETISVAETAAGGLISAAILATPGASQIYRGGLTVSWLAFPPYLFLVGGVSTTVPGGFPATCDDALEVRQRDTMQKWRSWENG
jgi:hypothetical protein